MILKINRKLVDHPTILSCMQTNSTQYAKRRIFYAPIGIKIHCSERPYAQLNRYIQPSGKDENCRSLMETIGRNKKLNDFNHSRRYYCFHFVIGKDAEGKIISVQTMPTEMKAWPDRYIHILICRPKKVTPQYIKEVCAQIKIIWEILFKYYNFKLKQLTIWSKDEWWFTSNNLTKEKIWDII